MSEEFKKEKIEVYEAGKLAPGPMLHGCMWNGE